MQYRPLIMMCAVAVAISACSSSAGVTSTQATPVRSAEPSLQSSPTATPSAIDPVAEPSGEPTVGVIAAGSDDLCDVIWSAVFANDVAEVTITGFDVDLSYEDISDGFAAVCEDNVLYEPNAESPRRFTLTGDVDDTLTLHGEAPLFEGLRMVDLVTMRERTTLPELDAERTEARSVGFLAVDAILAQDRGAVAALMADQVVELEGGTLITRSEFAERSPFESGVWAHAAPGREIDGDGRLGSLTDYVAHYAVTIEDVDVERWPALATSSDATAMYVFRGGAERPEGQGFLWDDLLTFVVGNTSDGWRILAVAN